MLFAPNFETMICDENDSVDKFVLLLYVCFNLFLSELVRISSY